jgi:hypothetical protein
MTALPGASQPSLSQSPTVLVSGAGNPAITSVDTMIDSSAGGGVTLPQNTDAWSFGTDGQPGYGLRGADPIRLSNIGPAAVTVHAFAGDAAPAVTVLPAFQCWDYLPSGSSNSWACLRQW